MSDNQNHPAYSVLRQVVTNVSKLKNNLGEGDVDVAVILTVVCGQVTGELERVTARVDGQVVVMPAARIDGVRGRGRVGVADIEVDDDAITMLRQIETVARVLADEGERMVDVEQRYAL